MTLFFSSHFREEKSTASILTQAASRKKLLLLDSI
jgi:hypothetical protein